MKKQLHLNTGLAFDQPFLSDYALWRQYLVANPGMTSLRIRKLLHENAPEHDLIVDRIRSLRYASNSTKFENDWVKFKSYTRQCPKCALILYHTNIYELTWLDHCPLHDCDFTLLCPVCNEPWPSKEEMTTRRCRGCSIFNLSELTRPFNEMIKDLPYHKIKTIYYNLRNANNRHYYSIVPRHSWYREWSGWHKVVPINSPNFLSFYNAKCAYDVLEFIRDLDLQVDNILCKKTRLYADDNDIDLRLMNMYLTPSACERITSSLNYSRENRQRAEHDVTCFILKWIDSNTAENHQTRFTSFRHLHLADLEEAPMFCPFCMAFSLWFIHTVTLLMHNKTAEMFNHYPFLRECGVNKLLGNDEPIIQVNYQTYFRGDNEFSDWFYRRGLEVTFLSILQLAFDLYDLVAQSSENTSNAKRISYPNIEVTGGYCNIEFINYKLEYYYETEHPLKKYYPKELRNIGSQCHAFHKHNQLQIIDQSKLPLEIFPKKKLSFKQFNKLQEDTIRSIYKSEESRYVEYMLQEIENGNIFAPRFRKLSSTAV